MKASLYVAIFRLIENKSVEGNLARPQLCDSVSGQ